MVHLTQPVDNQAIFFRDTRVVIWDAVNVVAEEYLRACAIAQKSSAKTKPST